MLRSELSVAQQQLLLSLARQSIQEGLNNGRAWKVDNEAYEPLLQVPGACFVTLTIAGQLRGCIGTLEARDPLVEAVAYYAYSAAFSDSRFSPLRADEFERIEIEISVLSPMKTLAVSNQQQLLEALVPHVHGLWIEDGNKKATFLPQVWDNLPSPQSFVEQLKLKAGMSAGHWSDSFKCYIYTVIFFEE
ncbi:MAG: AmmeMemoRadiSam system protein A [Motiliproteus sp.]